MGKNFTAILGHRLQRQDLYALCDALNHHSFSHIERFIEELLPYNQDDAGKAWSVDPDWLGGTVELDGPCGLSFTFSEKLCCLDHYIRWRAFVTDESIQFLLRGVAYDLAAYYQTGYALYVPDNDCKESFVLGFIYEDENRDMEYVTSWLLRECGPPKQRIRDIRVRREDDRDSDGYYLDSFGDFVGKRHSS